MSESRSEPARKLTRQQLRAQAREKRDAAGWIKALNIDDPWMARSIRDAVGTKRLTHAELEAALGMSFTSASSPAAPPAPPPAEPERIVVQHILISFTGAGTRATRAKAEAEVLARETLERARKGEEFASLVEELTDDSSPGIYRLSNTGVAPVSAEEHVRERMVPAFGNTGFSLDIDEIGMAEFDSRTSPYGWHIIKRLA